MLETHRHLLIANRPAIVEDLLVEDVLTELRSKFIIDRHDSELILEKGTTSRMKAEKLLDMLPSKGYNAFRFFYESLKDKYPHLAQLLIEGISEEQPLDGSSFVTTNTGLQGPMTSIHRDLLTANRVDIVDDLLVDDVITNLLSKFVFDNNDVELIRAEKTSKRQAEKLLDLLVTKGDDAFGYFLAALKDPYPHIAELLEMDNNNQRARVQSVLGDLQDVVESKLLEGGVPQRPLVFTNRPRELRFLRTALRSLTERDAWVVLHGMAGCGKTILAAEALRSASLLEKSFPGGVFWLKVGPVDRPKLLMKMQNLCSRLDEDKVRPLPRNLEEARDRLKAIFAHQHPRTLLVLDDLWTAHDARYFDIRARVLVTTRDVSIANCIEGTKCPVHVPEKLSVAQCLDILSQWTKKQATEMPIEAERIIEECTGHPLAVSMIGAMLRDHPARWLYYWSQLKSHKLSKLKSKFAYQYPSLSEAIAMSIENLSDDLRNKYHDFVLFDASIKVPRSVFCLLWDMEKEEVEDLMDDFVNKSLVKSAQASDGAHEHLGYAVHNLQLNYMLENCEDIEARHKRLVECFKKACKGKFSSLADDGYVYWNLIHHMLEAKLQSKAIDLLTNLTWVTRKLEVTGPADIINDYIKVTKLIEEEEKDEFKNLHDFYHFVRTNAHLFVSRPIPDVVQTALSEPANNDVYRQAKEEAVKRSKQGKLFVDWCNKHKETSYSLEMTLKPHDGAINCCSFSSDGKTIISSSSDGTAKVWEAVSGKVLHSLEDHDDVVNCCAFNCDNSKVLTTSHDKSVKIWKLGLHHDHELKLTYKDHKQDVYCAAFSPTASGKDVISCSADNTIRVWDCETGITRVVCKGHSDVVRWCCFSSDGEKLASASHDQTVKIWNAGTGDCLGTTPKHDAFVSYCCFNQDGCLVYASSDTCISIWDSISCESRGSLGIDFPVLAFVLSPVDEDKIAVALSDATIKLWDITNNKQLNVYHGHKSWVHTVDFSPDGTQLVSGSADETAKVWPVDTTAYAKRIKLKRVFDAFFAPDKVTIAVADSQNKLKIFEGLHGKERCESETQSSKLTCCVFSRNGINVAIGLGSGEIKVLAVETCHPVVKFDGHEAMIYTLAYSQSGSLLLSCSRDKSYMTWDVETGKALLLSKESRHEDAVTSGFFFDNDQRIATSSKDGTTKVWDSASGNLMFTCDHHRNEWVVVSAVSPDGEKLLTGSVDGEVKAWHAVSGEQIFNISPHSDCIRSLSIYENNQVFATGSDDGTVMISSLLDGKPLAPCTSHTESWVTDMAFAKNSSQLVTIGNNIQWHKIDGTLLQQFSIKGSRLRHIKWSEDFTTFITVDNIGVLYILKVIS